MTTYIICAECGAEVSQSGWSNDHDWEALTVCPECRTVEGDTYEMYMCDICGEFVEEVNDEGVCNDCEN